MRPTRMDLTMVSGSTKEFDFVLTGSTGPVDLTTALRVDVFVAKGNGKSWAYQYSTLVGDYLDPNNGIVRVALTFPASHNTQVWWYEVWRTDASGKIIPHIVGELKLIGSVRL